MVVGGFFIKRSYIRIVTLSGIQSAHVIVAPEIHKIELASKPSQEHVATFVEAIKTYVRANSVDGIVLNQRNEGRGKHAGGSASFRIEGILLAITPVRTVLAHNSTLTKLLKHIVTPPNIRPSTVELGKAYDLALCGLSKK